MLGSKKLVHIRLSDTGWILEKLASEIASRLPYVSYDLYPDSTAQIQYYMTYGCRQSRVSPIEIAYFTHKERIQEAADKFDRIAQDVDVCLAQSIATEQILHDIGAKNIQTISPGVDLDFYQTKLRIGVVGRTYHTGRKGEALVAQVMDVPGIEWVFTGSGWPGPSEYVAHEDMPAFYRSLDYVLVPALFEGGPMCVVEALACGCKVIASPVGWVPQFPHIEFRNGDAEDLRRVLTELVEEKMALRRTVESYTWDRFASEHHQLFVKLLGSDPMSVGEAPPVSPEGDNAVRAAVLVHGAEMSGSLGGPSVRAPRTAAALKRIGVEAEFFSTRQFDASDFDVLHALNVWQPEHCELLLQQIAKHRRPIVFSPIFLDLTEHDIFRHRVPEILRSAKSDSEMHDAFAELRRELAVRKSLPEAALEPRPGYFADVRRLATYADHLILLSEHEQRLLKSIGVDHPSVSFVQNPVEAGLFDKGDPHLFESKYGVKDYVLCVGRIETRKNQALLAYALRDTSIPLVLVGHEPDKAYAELIRSLGGPNVIFTGRIEPSSAMLASAYAGARVFCLPSWSEGAPLVALEAAAAGCNMVLSNRSSEEQYFGDLARYADPADPQNLRDKILAAYEENRPADKQQALQALIREKHSWRHYAEDTLKAYKSGIAAAQKRLVPTLPAREPTIYIDLTTLAHHKGTPTGMARVEERFANAFARQDRFDVNFVYWDSDLDQFIHIGRNVVAAGLVNSIRQNKNSMEAASADSSLFARVAFNEGDTVLNFGSGWMRNGRYLKALSQLKYTARVKLITTIYDVIQWKHKEWYPSETASEFIANATTLLDISDRILTCSDCSRNDIMAFGAAVRAAVPPVSRFTLGDEASIFNNDEALNLEALRRIDSKRGFVLFVSSLDYRKNHKFLVDIWNRLYENKGKTCPQLIFVGGTGWRSDEFVSYLTAHEHLQNTVIWLTDINDITLQKLYDECLFTVYPSLYEGWGMPVGESLRHGKLCIASTGGSLSEVALGYAEHIDPYDFAAWYKAIAKYTSSPALLAMKEEKIHSYVTRPWSEVTHEIMTAAEGDYIKPWLPVIQNDTPVVFSRSIVGAAQPYPYMVSGWGNIEENGCWSIGSNASLIMRADVQPGESVSIAFNLNAFMPDDVPVSVAVYVNETAMSKWAVTGNEDHYALNIPFKLIDDNNAVRIRFNILNPRSPNAYGKSGDIRLLGVKLLSLEVKKNAICVTPNVWCENPARIDDKIQITTPISPRPPVLAFSLETEKPAWVRVLVNGAEAANFAARGASEILKSINLDLLSLSMQGNMMEVEFVSEPPVPLKINRIGLFSRVPPECVKSIIEDKTTDTKTLTSSQHVAYAGAPVQIGIGQPLSLGANPAVNDAMLGGWYLPEPSYSWFNGNAASVYISTRANLNRFDLDIGYSVLESLANTAFELFVKVGQQAPVKLTAHQTGGHSQKISVSRKVAIDDEGRIAVTFMCPAALSPFELGLSIDRRSLAAAVHSLTLLEQTDGVVTRPKTSPATSQVSTAQIGNVPFTLQGGWHAPEADGIWSSGKPAQIGLDMSHLGSKSAKVELRLSPFSGPNHKAPVDLDIGVVGGETVRIQLKPGKIAKKSIMIPAEAITCNGGQVTLALSSQYAVCPLDAGYSIDGRPLSFKLHGLKA